MTLIAIGSAKAAPGVTTLTVALAALSGPAAVAADLDPDGGDLALRYRRPDGAPLEEDLGLLSLAASLRGEPGAGDDRVATVGGHLQVTAGGLAVLLGVSGPDQAVGLGPLWPRLALALAQDEHAVFADCGRIGPTSPAMPVLIAANAVIMLARAELEELSHLRERLRFLLATLPGGPAGPARIGVVLVAAERDRAAAPRTEQLLAASGVNVPVLATIAIDPRGAAKLRGMGSGRTGRTTLVRSVRSLLPAVHALAGLTGAGLAVIGPPSAPTAGSPTVSSPTVSAPTAPAALAPSIEEAAIEPVTTEVPVLVAPVLEQPAIERSVPQPTPVEEASREPQDGDLAPEAPVLLEPAAHERVAAAQNRRG